MINEIFYFNIFLILTILLISLYLNKMFLENSINGGLILFCILIAIGYFSGIIEDYFFTIIIIILIILLYKELS